MDITKNRDPWRKERETRENGEKKEIEHKERREREPWIKKGWNL